MRAVPLRTPLALPLEFSCQILYTFDMEKHTWSIKVSKRFVKKYREFCDLHALSVGKFTEQKLLEVMEDYYFGMQAHKVLSVSDSRRKKLKDLTV